MHSLSKFRTPPHSKTMGIEIECILGASEVQYFQHYGFFYSALDMSIETSSWGERGVEFVSQPLPVKMLCKQIDKLGKRFMWESNTSTGIHIHVSRQWLSTKKAIAIYNWIKTLTNAEFKLLFGREPNYYCRIEGPIGSTRYLAVNTENKATIEFRMFSSGSADWAKYCVKMAEYLVCNAYHLNLDAALAFKDLYFKTF
jgi:hypothetical protein